MPGVPQPRTRDLGVLSLVAIAPIWGYSWVVSKVALGYAPPFTFIAIATTLSAICLFLVLLVTRRSLRPPPLGWTVLISLLQTTLFNCLATVALAFAGLVLVVRPWDVGAAPTSTRSPLPPGRWPSAPCS